MLSVEAAPAGDTLSLTVANSSRQRWRHDRPGAAVCCCDAIKAIGVPWVAEVMRPALVLLQTWWGWPCREFAGLPPLCLVNLARFGVGLSNRNFYLIRYAVKSGDTKAVRPRSAAILPT